MTRYLILCGVWIIVAVLPLKIDAREEPRTSGKSDLITVVYPNGTRIQAELADTEEKRARGLMFREHLARDRGMLFIFSEPGQWSFWMKNTKVPLDILWLDHKKKIVDLAENIPGCVGDPCLQYQPAQEATYVLEVSAGTVGRQKLARGMQLSFDLPKR
ncbi:MAG TPA: DUF192 domain-containing protein [Nitrospirales bacterium]|jgi:hypothetical protein